MEYKSGISEEEVLAPFRRQEATQAAFDAVMAEIWAAQYRALKAAFPRQNGIDADLADREKQAAAAKERSSNLLQLADLTRAQVEQAVLEGLRNQLKAFEEEHIRKSDILSHPEAYGERLGEAAEFDVARTEEAVKATQAAIEEWEGGADAERS